MKTFHLCATALASVVVLAANAPPTEVIAPEDARGTYRQLVKDHGAAVKEYEAEVKRLEESDKHEAAEYAESWNPTPAFVELFAGAAEEYIGTEDAVQFLLWILQNDKEEEELSAASTAALDTLIDQHGENPSFSSSVQYIGFRMSMYGQVRTIAICDRVIERSKGDLRLVGLYGRGVARAQSSELDQAKADFMAIPADTEIGKQAKGYIFELENLRIGMTAPDIADRDLDGVEFKLSDYRGKVVVLDFWGDW
jgi:hypothetical protein